jgi:hypothetical protein
MLPLVTSCEIVMETIIRMGTDGEAFQFPCRTWKERNLEELVA